MANNFCFAAHSSTNLEAVHCSHFDLALSGKFLLQQFLLCFVGCDDANTILPNFSTHNTTQFGDHATLAGITQRAENKENKFQIVCVCTYICIVGSVCVCMYICMYCRFCVCVCMYICMYCT